VNIVSYRVESLLQLRKANGCCGSQADILPQFSRAAAMRREAAPQLASWRQSQYGQERTAAAVQIYGSWEKIIVKSPAEMRAGSFVVLLVNTATKVSFSRA